MDTIFHFVSEYIYVYVWTIFTTSINIIAPISASTVVNPVTAFFTDPQRAIGIGAFTFFFTGLHRVYLFRKEILSDSSNVELIKSNLPFSIVGALFGGLVITYINAKALAVVIILTSLYFIFKTIWHLISAQTRVRRVGKLGHILIFTLSGFLQGSGMQGADIRNNYLRTFVSEVSVRAVGSAFGLTNFFIAGSIILLRNRLLMSDIIFIATLIPFLIVAQIYGVHFLRKMEDRHAKMLAVSLSVIGIILLTYKYLL